MTSIHEVLSIFTPFVQEAKDRQKANQRSALDEKICILADKINDVKQSMGGTCIMGQEIHYSELSCTLSLADLHTLIDCSEVLAKKMVEFLSLEHNFDLFKPHFRVEERIKIISDRVLRHISLFHLKLIQTTKQAMNGAAWYALAPDEQFLKRQVSDLKSITFYSKVLAARIGDVEEKNPQLFNNHLHEQLVDSCGLPFNQLNLTIGKLRTLSGEELNGIAAQLPVSACKLLSDNQIQSLNFDWFCDAQLDALIEGEGTKEEISRRLDLLNADQVKTFLNKSTGAHCDGFSEAFYQKLSLKQYNKEQINKLFNTSDGAKLAQARRNLQFVDPKEFCEGLDLLSWSHCRLIVDLQIESMDYSQSPLARLQALFLSEQIPEDEKIRRIQLIPIHAVNNALFVSKKIFCYLSPLQVQAVDFELFTSYSRFAAK
jgi:hypothetical protein